MAITKEPENEYNRRVADWLVAHGITFAVTFIGEEQGFNGVAAINSKGMHDLYSATFNRETPRKAVLTVPKFYQSTAHSASAGAGKKCTDKRCGVQYGETSIHRRGCPSTTAEIPSAYSILSCLTLNDPGTFADFCGDYGYDFDSRKAERAYFAVQDEWTRVRSFFTPDELDALQEIAR